MNGNLLCWKIRRLSTSRPCLATKKRGFNEFGVQPGVGPAQTCQCSWQINHPSFGGLFQQTNGSDHSQTALPGRVAPSLVVHQHRVGVDFLGEANSFPFTQGGSADAHWRTAGGVLGCCISRNTVGGITTWWNNWGNTSAAWHKIR